jgi:uncharacterized circularly permuted ATP-grasp superfamily protein/uncharacterized alpha-E superfamily protein
MISTPAAEPFDHAELLRRYRLQTALHDEMSTPAGSLRSHWRYLFDNFLSLGPEEWEIRREEACRVLRENGVTYNVYGDPQGAERLWELDPIPLLITSQEWSGIEAGLIQRAELLDLVLRDLYGARKLISRGVIPPEIVYGHPGFLLPCAGSVTSHKHLTTYAADLVRQPDGGFAVVGDRTQAPSGAGYALENRIVMSRIVPSLYRDSHVHRLSGFFRTLRSTLIDFGSRYDDNPRVVVLSPGSVNETYFEQAYLANYLGFNLVEGNDLVIRDSKVWLRALDGLKRVHVILRRVDDSYCDPLELRPESLLGVPGLLQAVRSGHVVVCNSLGSSLLENDAMKRFLPELSRQLLGQELRLPSYETYWCGLAADRKYVISHISQLVVKPITGPVSESSVGSRLTSSQRRTLIERIQSRPHYYVAQPPITHSTTPVLLGGTLEPRPLVLRTFLVSRDESYVVMPGGLTRVALDRHERLVTNQRGGVSKDTWVLASEREQIEPARPTSQPEPTPVLLALTRAGGEIAPRVAENMFWLGRYIERSDSVARLLREVIVRMLDAAPGRQTVLNILFPALSRQTGTVSGFSTALDSRKLPENAEQELLSLVCDPNRIGSLHYNIQRLMQAGREVHDRMSEDTWRIISGLDDEFPNLNGDESPDLDGALESIEHIIKSVSSLIGLVTESMTRGQSYYFLEVGRRTERALDIIELLRSLVCQTDRTAPTSVWDSVLAVCDSRMTYARRYRLDPQPGPVLDLLLQDETNPRAVRFQLSALRVVAPALPGERDAAPDDSAESIVLDTLGLLPTMDVDSLVTLPEESGWRGAFQRYIDDIADRLRSLSDLLGRKYFRIADRPQQLVPINSNEPGPGEPGPNEGGPNEPGPNEPGPGEPEGVVTSGTAV